MYRKLIAALHRAAGDPVEFFRLAGEEYTLSGAHLAGRLVRGRVVFYHNKDKGGAA